tara:strand:- start:2498 stop:2686 length:189 start_codon:yes stop_codon:yes gene_type:complete
MIKEFKISEILSAVGKISEIERKKVDAIETKNDSSPISDILRHNNQVKSNKSDILVLDEMIE